MEHENARKLLIEQLRYFQERPTMFVRKVDVSHVEAFLQGIDVALCAFGLNLDHRAVWESHGIEEHPLTIGHRMQMQGVEQESIIAKLLELMIDALQREGAGPLQQPP